jgi:hypothetical protein
MWLKVVLKDEDDAEWFAKRMANFISGGDIIEKRDDGGWNIGKSNDWWLFKKENSWLLQYRYGTVEQMDALQVGLNWFFGIKSEMV